MSPLIGLDAPPPFDIWSDTYSDIRDRFGKGLSNEELFQLATKVWGTGMRQVKFFISKGARAIKRHPLNSGRGDAGSRAGLQKSIESVGLLRGLQKGPYLIADPNDPECWESAHWATTCESYYDAEETD